MQQNNIVYSKLTGIIERITFHNPENGWSVIKVSPFNKPGELVTVVIFQSKVYAGATMEFEGQWVEHTKFGRQFKAQKFTEKKPASTAALEKYLGSGLIYGVGPKTAKKIVRHFGDKTLSIFESNISDLLNVQGIAKKKLKTIKSSWEEHREIRNVMIFLQSYGISTLFAVKIYKTYGNDSISKVRNNPYQLARDIFGIGFFSADKVALNLGFAIDSKERIQASIKHVLAASRENGHCYLSKSQILENVNKLINLDLFSSLSQHLKEMEESDELKVRGENYYSKSLFFDELSVAKNIKKLNKQKINIDKKRITHWIYNYCSNQNIDLSNEQKESIIEIVGQSFSILTGGPGCGKTTTTKVLVKLLMAMKKKVILAAPTGRAAQRMLEVIGISAKTIHRLLVWNPRNGGFKKNEKDPLEVDFLIIDETSMLDISLTASLLKAVPENSQVLFIGDADQLPSVGAGNVLKDLIESDMVYCFELTKVFRQAQQSLIISYAHQINQGNIPRIESPFKNPQVWSQQKDCLFIDSEELTKEQIRFILKAKKAVSELSKDQGEFDLYGEKELKDNLIESGLNIPKKFDHVDLLKLSKTKETVEEIKTIIKKIHPWSTVHYGLKAKDILLKIYLESIPRYLGESAEIQILSPMIKGTLGTSNLNVEIQNHKNPRKEGQLEIKLGGEKVIRQNDRIIQKRNNYDLNVFNGDIGIVKEINPVSLECQIIFDINSRDSRSVIYKKENLQEIDLAYAITIHKSQGSEFDVVIIPIVTQHFKMLFRNLIYTGLTRAKKMAIFLGTRRALAMGIRNIDSRKRQTALAELLL